MMEATAGEPPGAAMDELPRTIWYMGAKGRVIPGLLDRALAELVPPGGSVLDLFSGSAIVSAFCARKWTVVANDVQLYSRVIAASLIERPPGASGTFERAIDIDGDLLPSFEENRRALADLYRPAIEMEAALLSEDLPRRRSAPHSAARADLAARLRDFLSRPGGLHGGAGAGPVGRGSGGNGENGGGAENIDPIYRGAAGLLAEASMARYRQDPRRRPACFITAYYASFYYGLRQAIDLDSLRAAIDELPRSDPLAERKRLHYLSALLHAASVTTSGTSHFAQPRQLTKDSEVLAMADRRRLDVVETFRGFSAAIARRVAASDLSPRNRTFCGDYRNLIDGGGGAPRWKKEAAADAIYMDPPYTGDNYSRFYHVLETLARYDYPELERDGRGRPTAGRYPVIEKRFQSGFCSPRSVENEFRRVIEASAVSGVPLVISYGSPNGLLLKVYRDRHPDRDPVECLEDVCRERYESVETDRRRLIHSGQGDKNRDTDELLVVCTRPRP